MVLSAHHWQHRFPVSKRKHADFRPDHVFFNDDRRAGIAEGVIGQHVFDGFVCFFAGHADDDALTSSQPVGLDHAWHADLVDEGFRFLHIGEGVEGCCWDAIFFHQLFRESLAAFELCSRFVWAEAGKPGFLERIHDAQRQWQFRTDNSEIDPFRFREIHKACDIVNLDIDERRHIDHADVTRSDINFCIRALGDLPAKCMFTTAAAHY